MIGTEQSIGYGKNRHTVGNDPFSWEELSELETFIVSQLDGTFLAGISLPGTDMSSKTYKFSTETEADMWLKNMSQKFTDLKNSSAR